MPPTFEHFESRNAQPASQAGVMVAGPASQEELWRRAEISCGKIFRANGGGLFQKTKEHRYGNKQRERPGAHERA